MDTSHINKVKTPQHFKTRRSCQPPDSVVTGSVIIFLLNPTFSIIFATSSFVDPQAWMRLRASRVARHAFYTS